MKLYNEKRFSLWLLIVLTTRQSRTFHVMRILNKRLPNEIKNTGTLMITIKILFPFLKQEVVPNSYDIILNVGQS